MILKNCTISACSLLKSSHICKGREDGVWMKRGWSEDYRVIIERLHEWFHLGPPLFCFLATLLVLIGTLLFRFVGSRIRSCYGVRVMGVKNSRHEQHKMDNDMCTTSTYTTTCEKFHHSPPTIYYATTREKFHHLPPHPTSASPAAPATAKPAPQQPVQKHRHTRFLLINCQQ